MSITTQLIASSHRDEVEYPSSDGQPMGETGLHVLAIIFLYEVLHDVLPTSDFIAADMFWYWEEGQPRSRVAPDVMVVKGVGRGHRRSFFTWRENGAVPAVVFEMASLSTWREDLSEKLRLYERLGVREYFLFDPEGEYLRPPLVGFRLVGGHYVPIDLDDDDRLTSEELGFMLKGEGVMLRLIDTTGALVLTPRERAEKEQQRAEKEQQRAEKEQQRAEKEQQRAEKEQQRAEKEQQRAEKEQQRAEQERQMAEQERQRADRLAAEVERMKALLEQARRGLAE